MPVTVPYKGATQIKELNILPCQAVVWFVVILSF